LFTFIGASNEKTRSGKAKAGQQQERELKSRNKKAQGVNLGLYVVALLSLPELV